MPIRINLLSRRAVTLLLLYCNTLAEAPLLKTDQLAHPLHDIGYQKVLELYITSSHTSKYGRLGVHQSTRFKSVCLSVCLLFFIDAFRDLYFGYVYNFALLLSIGILYLLLFFFTKVRFNDIVVFISLLICFFLVFLFSTLDGFKNGITYYYFAIILAVVFLFNERKNYILGIVVLITILFLFSYSSLHDLSLFENTKSLSPHRAKNIMIHTFMQVFLITVFHGYFIVSKNRKITELCLQQERSKHNIALLR